MKRSAGWVATAAFALVAFGVGWYVSRATLDQGPPLARPTAMGPALETALAEGSPTLRLRRLAEALEHLDSSNLEQALAVIDREWSILQEPELQIFFEAWARFDAASALGHPERWATSKRQAAMGAAIQSWALTDPQAAKLAVARLLEETPARRRNPVRQLVRQDLVHRLVVGWVHSGVPGYLEYVAGLPEGLRSVGSVAMVGAQTRRLGADALMSWADGALGEADPDFQKEIFRRVAKAAARRDPAATAAWVLTHVDREYAVDGVRLVAEKWLPQQPDAAFAWLTSLAPEALRPEAIRSAAGMWMGRDFEAAAAWLESQSVAAHHDPLLEVYARQLAARSDDASVRWAERIQDEELREASLKAVATLWYQRDPEAAEAWLETSPLDETARAAVRDAPRPRGGQRRRAGEPLGAAADAPDAEARPPAPSSGR